MTAIIAAPTHFPAMLKNMGNITKEYINYNKYFNKNFFFLAPVKTTIARPGNSRRYLRLAHLTRMLTNEI